MCVKEDVEAALQRLREKRQADIERIKRSSSYKAAEDEAVEAAGEAARKVNESIKSIVKRAGLGFPKPLRLVTEVALIGPDCNSIRLDCVPSMELSADGKAVKSRAYGVTVFLAKPPAAYARMRDEIDEINAEYEKNKKALDGLLESTVRGVKLSGCPNDIEGLMSNLASKIAEIIS